MDTLHRVHQRRARRGCRACCTGHTYGGAAQRQVRIAAQGRRVSGRAAGRPTPASAGPAAYDVDGRGSTWHPSRVFRCG
ncbi:hypothetical protein WOLCODRAFT_139975 [Wolfiporia cocos MD-104 SS10]|uniref:Uncharacterized protein n=1 Tax=Wolfiporia cocos (strain MD-104) TaxID=742152 RepID=A0A2H3J044_WOLCO|nr:hypothetical protein WOLCODRAFT_139975 [Wolfiporia cocos MD-104 SS10]